MVQKRRRAKEKKEFTQPNAKSKVLRRAKFKEVLFDTFTLSRESVNVRMFKVSKQWKRRRID